MTDKRFTCKIDESDGHLVDVWYDNGKPIYSGSKVCDLLNELHEENEKLHDEIFRLRTELAYDRTVNDGKDWFKAEDEHLKWKSGEND